MAAVLNIKLPCLIIFLLICIISDASPAFVDQRSDPVDEPAETILYIRDVVFNGNKTLSDSELAGLLGISPGQKFDAKLIEDGLNRVLTGYKDRGYMFAKATWKYESSGNDQVIVYIDIDEGEAIRMGDISLSGNAVFSTERLLRSLDIRKSRYFRESVFQSDMERLLRFYSENGYPLAKISPSVVMENNKLNIRIDIDEGQPVRIEQIKIGGLKKTKENVVLREFAIQPGDIFNQRKIDESYRRLSNLGYFRNVSQIWFSQAENGNVTVNSSVEEGRTGRFSGLIGYNPSDADTGERKFVGVIEAIERNLLGTGRRISVRGRFGTIDIYELEYCEPWVLGSPVDLGIHFMGTKRTDRITDQSLREQEAGLSGTGRMVRSMSGSLALVYKRLRSSVATDPLTNGCKYSVVSSIQRDSRDYFMNPSTGRLDRITTEISRGDFKLIKTWVDLHQYFKTFRRQVIAVGLHGARVWGSKIPPTEMLYMGGANSLRGYTEDFFRGDGMLFANCEYRFIVGRNSQFFLFLDGGSIYNKGDGLSPLKLGYGLGMRLESITGLVSMDYGLAKGDSILKGKIHVSLGTTF